MSLFLYKADVCCLFFASIFYSNHQIILRGNFILFKIYYYSTPFFALEWQLDRFGSKIDTKHLWQAYTCLTKKNYYSNDFLRKKGKYSKRHFFMYVSSKKSDAKKMALTSWEKQIRICSFYCLTSEQVLFERQFGLEKWL